MQSNAMKNFVPLAIVFAFAWLSLVTVESGPAQTVPADPPTASQRNEETRKKLAQPLSFDFDETAFSDVQLFFEEELGVNVLLDQSAKDDSLTADEPIVFQLTEVPGDHALQMLLATKNATYTLQAGVIRIISLDDAVEPRFLGSKVFNVTRILNSFAAWNAEGNANEAMDNEQDPINPVQPADAGYIIEEQMLLNLLNASIRPITDRFQNPEQPEVHATTHTLVAGQLVVRGPESTIREVDELLHTLRSQLSP
jgi:hypothetical protein